MHGFDVLLCLFVIQLILMIIQRCSGSIHRFKILPQCTTEFLIPRTHCFAVSTHARGTPPRSHIDFTSCLAKLKILRGHLKKVPTLQENIFYLFRGRWLKSEKAKISILYQTPQFYRIHLRWQCFGRWGWGSGVVYLGAGEEGVETWEKGNWAVDLGVGDRYGVWM